jgi:peroxiredoxin
MGIRRVLGAAAIAAVLTLAAACGGDTARQTGTSSGGTSRDAAVAPDLDFTVATLDGGTFDGRSLAGKPAVLWFWAPWCPTCVAQARDVTGLAAGYSGKAAVVGVAGLDTVSAMHEFVAMTNVASFPHLADEEGVVWKRFGVTAQSTFVVLDPAGAVVASGNLEPEELRTHLDRMVTAA